MLSVYKQKTKLFTSVNDYDILFLQYRCFEVEIVLLRTLRVKRNAGRGTPAKVLYDTKV